MIQDFLEKDQNSKLREQITEYKFLTELFTFCASQKRVLELLKAEHDSFGYDLILKIGKLTKYVQLKSKKLGGKTSIWNVRKSLLSNENGTVILLEIDYSGSELNLMYGILDESKRDAAKNRPSKSKKEWQCQVNNGEIIKKLEIGELAEKLFPNEFNLS
jgi:hypothetical protein